MVFLGAQVLLSLVAAHAAATPVGDLLFAEAQKSTDITNDQAAELAKKYVRELKPGHPLNNPSIFKSSIDKYQTDIYIVRVSFGEVMVSLDQHGAFLSFADMSRQSVPKGAKPVLKSDEQAWKAFESALKKCDPPQGLKRIKITHRSSGSNSSYSFQMKVKPYGYDSVGNAAFGTVNAFNGRVIEVFIGRGWTYEKPNIKVSRSEALKLVVAKYGGVATDWKSKIEYNNFPTERSPKYLQDMSRERKMRLHYQFWSKHGNVFVDSVTGEVHDFLPPQS